MTDLQRDIGGLEARMDEHEKRVDRIEQKIDDGFTQVRQQSDAGFARIHQRIDELAEAEHRRKGALGLLKMLFSGGVITGIFEGAKALFGAHK
jgi:uncharacterized protein involved in exopolysaccharide biosynthesis